MIELRFHHEIYDGFAVDEAAKVYGAYASMDLVREAEGYVVRLRASAEATAAGIDERVLAAELANYALGLTVERAAEEAR
jgi:hypothetical protein